MRLTITHGDNAGERSGAYAFLCAGDYHGGSLYANTPEDHTALAAKLADCLASLVRGGNGQAQDVCLAFPGVTLLWERA